MPVIVEARLYSGRLNPRWELTPEQVHAVKRIVASILHQSLRGRPPHKLGYTGFSIYSTIDNESSSSDSLPSVLHVFAGTIEYDQPGSTLRDDTNNELENYLLETAQSHISDPQKDIIKQKMKELSDYKAELQ